jgi:hypothetical protein
MVLIFSLFIYILQFISNKYAVTFIEIGRFSQEIHIFSLVSPLVMACLMLWGYFDALSEVKNRQYKYEISLKIL